MPRKPKVLRPVHPNAGIEAAYRRRLIRLIEEMHRSFLYWISAAYRRDPPRLAADDAPGEFAKTIRTMARQWGRRFAELAENLAAYFAQDVAQRSDAALKNILKQSGIAIEWKMTAAQREVLRAIVAQNVALIKSIPQEYLARVEQLVLQSVTTGRDLHQLRKDIEEQFRVTRRRATLISRDQNNKATSALHRVRQIELGVKQAIWLHSGAGKHPRPTHLANNGKRYSVADGWYDPHEKKRIWPGQLINCRCASKSIVKGFT